MNPNAGTTSTEYSRPHRPWVVRMVNSIGNAARSAGLGRELDPQQIVDAACRRNRLRDYGEEEFLDALAILVKSVNEEAGLNTTGRFITAQRIIGVLGNRLRAQKLFNEHPGILDQKTAPLIIITGLQRTGTTRLHRLLAADPYTRSLASWEALNPAPFLPYEPRKPDRRKKIAQRSERALSFLAPDFFAVHPVEAEAPEEDSILLDFSFLSPVSEATLRVPSYSSWLEKQDMAPAYTYFEKLLKLLQWQRPAGRWVLKTPHHMNCLDIVFRMFPDARVIQTHRDPCVTVASICSMIAHGRGVFSDLIDPVEIGIEWSKKQSCMVNAAKRVRDCGYEDRVLDVFFDELTADPMNQVMRIYEFAEMDFTQAARKAVDMEIKTGVKDRYGSHSYSLKDFGLDAVTIRGMFAEYCKNYGL